MNSEELIKNNSLSNISVDVDQKVVFVEIALTAINMVRIEAYNQAIDDVLANIVISSDYYFDCRTCEWKRDDPTFNKNDILNLKK